MIGGRQLAAAGWWAGAGGKKLAKEHNFTAAEIKEYKAYIKLFKEIGK